MGILNELLEMTKNSDLDLKVKQISDEIMKEERPKFANKSDEPIGANIFLAVQFDDNGATSFLCLERELAETYIVSLWARLKNTQGSLKRKRTCEAKDTSKAEKILKFYAETLKYVRGE